MLAEHGNERSDDRAEERGIGGVRVVADGSTAITESAALLALIADASGGATLPPDEVDEAVRGFEATRLATSTWRMPASWRIPMLLLLLGLAVADWAVRRLRGAP